MHGFTKGPAPRELLEFVRAKTNVEGRHIATVGWDELDAATKTSLRSALAEHQGYLCAYCASRIWPDAEGMRIEHWDPQHAAPAKRFEWNNLLGVCHGGDGRDSHCDRRRAELPPSEQRLTLKPDRDVEPIRALLRYEASPCGLRIVAPSNAGARKDVEVTLALNTQRLATNRSAALAGIRKRVRDRFGERVITRSFLDGLTTPSLSRGYVALEPYLPALLPTLNGWRRKLAGV